MLAPVVFHAPGHADFTPLHIAPWADEPDAHRWPPALARLRGDWPCVPFGRIDRPDALPDTWAPRTPNDDWGHGHAAHHDWQWLETGDPQCLQLQITLPEAHDIHRLSRSVRAVPGTAALELELVIEARRPCQLPAALHPTLRLNAGRVRLSVPHHGPGVTYPVAPEPGHSRAAIDARFDSLAAVPLGAGGSADFTTYPQPVDSEELMQLMDIRGAVGVDYLDAGWHLEIDWDRALLPDLMLWVSHGGRHHAPWNGRHYALGLEPVNAALDLGRVAKPPAGHALAARNGLTLTPERPCVIRSRLCARPLEHRA